MDSIHAKCAAIGRDNNGRTLFCHKSKGHRNSECYDVSEDVRFTPEYKPGSRKSR